MDDAAQLAATVIVAAVVAMAFDQDECSSVLPASFKNSFDAECGMREHLDVNPVQLVTFDIHLWLGTHKCYVLPSRSHR